MSEGSAKRRFRFSMRTLLLLVTGLACLAAYSASYYRLSRRGMRELDDVHMFLYVSLDDLEGSNDLGRHHRLGVFFAPANFIDRHVFGGPSPAQGGMHHLD